MQTSNKSINRDQLQEAYIESIIDGMDHKTMYQFVYDSLDGNLDDYTTEELVTEVKDYYPELLEENTVSVTEGRKFAEQTVTYGEEMQEGSWY